MIKHKTKIAVLDSGDLQFQCSCGILGNVFLQGENAAVALAAAESEQREHLEDMA